MRIDRQIVGVVCGWKPRFSRVKPDFTWAPRPSRAVWLVGVGVQRKERYLPNWASTLAWSRASAKAHLASAFYCKA